MKNNKQQEENREAAKISALSSGKTDINFLQAKKYCHLIKVKVK